MPERRVANSGRMSAKETSIDSLVSPTFRQPSARWCEPSGAAKVAPSVFASFDGLKMTTVGVPSGC